MHRTDITKCNILVTEAYDGDVAKRLWPMWYRCVWTTWVAMLESETAALPRGRGWMEENPKPRRAITPVECGSCVLYNESTGSTSTFNGDAHVASVAQYTSVFLVSVHSDMSGQRHSDSNLRASDAAHEDPRIPRTSVGGENDVWNRKPENQMV